VIKLSKKTAQKVPGMVKGVILEIRMKGCGLELCGPGHGPMAGSCENNDEPSGSLGKYFSGLA
jgi:hypothetical protein